MTSTIEQHFVKQFSANVWMLSQQKNSRLLSTTRIETLTGEEAYFDRIAKTAAVKRVTRHGDTPLIEVEHSRRRVAPEDYEWATLIDRQDKLKMISDPTSSYSMAAAAAMGRAMDDVVIAAALGVAYAGKSGTTAVSLPAGQQIAASATGLTLAKLLSAREKLDAAEVMDEERYFLVSAKQMTNLLGTTEITNADYNVVRALVSGSVDSYLGFKFIRTERLPVNGSGHRQCIAYQKQGLLTGLAQQPVARIEERADKSFSNQVYYSMSLGAVRMEDESVVQIDCTE